jgi:hypothetical protein
MLHYYKEVNTPKKYFVGMGKRRGKEKESESTLYASLFVF